MVVSPKPIWFDVDGVLLDWINPFLKFLNSDVLYEELQDYAMTSVCEDFAEKVKEFNDTIAYSKLRPLVPVEDLQALKDKGFILNLITQVDGTYARRLRTMNLDKVFGHDMFHTVLFTSSKHKKVDVLRGIEPYETIHIVEDNPGFVRDAMKDGNFRVMAVEHPYNRSELWAMQKEARDTFPSYRSAKEVVKELLRHGRLK